MGFEIDLARRLAQDLLGDPQAVRLVPLAHRDRLYALLNDEVDLVVAQLTATAIAVASSNLVPLTTSMAWR